MTFNSRLCRTCRTYISQKSTLFHRDNKGIAAVEFAVIAPILALGLILMVDIGEAVFVKFNVERKIRLAIEGVIRYGNDPEKVLAFANASGSSAFKDNNDVSENSSALTIEPYYICRGSQVSQFVTLDKANCPNYETWYDIKATGSVDTLFGKTFDLNTAVNLLAD